MARVQNSEKLLCDGKRSDVSESESRLVVESVGSARLRKKIVSSLTNDSFLSYEDGNPSPDYYSDWYFEMKDFEKLKFRRAILENRYGEFGKFGKKDEVLDEENWLLPESFSAKMVCEKRTKLKVILVISLEKLMIEVDPDSEECRKGDVKGLEFPISFDSSEIVACEILKRKSHNRTMFRIIIYTEDSSKCAVYKKTDFESNTVTADMILEKLHGIFEVRTSPLREDYLEIMHNEKEKNGIKRIFSFRFL